MCTYLHGPRIGGMYYFRMGVPAHLRSIVGKREFCFSLGVKDRDIAKRLVPGETVKAQALLDAAEHQFQSDISARGSRVGDAHPLAQEEAAFDAALAAESAARQAGRKDLRDYLRRRMRLSTAHLSPEEAAMKDLVEAAEWDRPAFDDRLAVLTDRNISQPREQRRLARAQSQSPSSVSIIDMFEGYARQPGIRPETVKQFRSIILHLVAFLGHDDAQLVSPQDIVRWRQHLVSEVGRNGRVRAAKTINGSYLAAASVTFAFGFNDLTLSQNPMAEVGKVQADKKVQLRGKDFTNAERSTILTATLTPQPSGLSREHALARRWVPWLCAYTGARVNEITQLRAEDVVKIDGTWTITITPEAGSVKTDQARTVPLHEHVVSQGFPAFAEASQSGPLFYRAATGASLGKRGRHKRVGVHLAAWVRSLGITEAAIKPNHAWRHTYKTICLEVGIQERVADYVQGHSSKGIGRSYGSNTIAALARELESFPRFPVSA